MSGTGEGRRGPPRGRVATGGGPSEGLGRASGRPGLWLFLAILLATGCAREVELYSGPPGTVGMPGPDTVSGVVWEIGSTPFTRTIIEGEEKTVGVAGEYLPEIARLAGAEVRASGRLGTRAPFGPELEVTAYEILSVDGERPHLGTLGRDEDGYFVAVAGDGKLRLGAVPLRFEKLVGARVWVLTDERGTVLRYGILRDPPVEEADPASPEPSGTPPDPGASFEPDPR